MQRLIAAMLSLAILTFASAADAKPRHHKQTRIAATESVQCAMDNNGRQVCGNYLDRTTAYANGNGGEVVGRRPPGCPHRYCGCEASLYKFGRIIPELNLAANWIRKFPRTSPAPGMAAARRGHVMILLSQADGDNWLTHDGNSGGGLTRVHVRSIRGYVVVNPDATMMASQ